MSINTIALSSGARSNLASLRQTATSLSTTEERLATGLKVNSALDNATEYFASKGFLNRANDLSNLKDSLSTSVQSLTSTNNSVESISSLVEQLQAVCTSALQTQDTTTRATYATQYNALMVQVDQLVSDATFNGTNLLNGSANLLVYFNETNTTALTISGVNITSTGLGLQASSLNAFVNVSDINSAQSFLQTAMNTLRSDAAQFGNNSTILTTRQTFTDNLIDTLQTASDNLITADTNEESANLQALQTRNQLAVISLGISNSSEQAILRLF